MSLAAEAFVSQIAGNVLTLSSVYSVVYLTLANITLLANARHVAFP